MPKQLYETAGGDADVALVELIKSALAGGIIGAAMLPLRVPSEDSYAWVLAREPELLDRARPLPPVMPVQGAKALSSFTKRGPAPIETAVIMRPCEVRALRELEKVDQVNLKGIVLISADCAGVLPLGDYLDDPAAGEEVYESAASVGNLEPMRPLCAACEFFADAPSDIHLMSFGTEEPLLSAKTEKGQEFLEELGLDATKIPDDRESVVRELEEKRSANRNSLREEFAPEHTGAAGLVESFASCIDCHNCMRVCPVCYCRRCYYESDKVHLRPEQHLARAEMKGAVKLSPNVLIYHLGRMAHMSTYCVSCGMCSDACPKDIPVGRLMALSAEGSRELFDYVAGISSEDRPLRNYAREGESEKIMELTSDPLGEFED